jgi:hypothetical protein
LKRKRAKKIRSVVFMWLRIVLFKGNPILQTFCPACPERPKKYLLNMYL